MSTQAMPLPEPSDAAAEIASQRKLLERMEPMRLVSSTVAFGLMALFLPAWLALAAMGGDLLFEGLGLRLMDGLNPERNRSRYLGVMASVFLMEVSYALPCLLIWQQDVAFAKALATGLLCMTLFQLSTVRAIHLPFGQAGVAGVGLVTLLGNVIYWDSAGDLVGLTLSTLGVIAAMIYTVGAMLSNHALHREVSKRGGEADSANRAKGRFLAQMSHELRTPLNAILGMGEAELATSQDKGTQERMQTLVSSARGLACILDDILEISALEETGVPIRPVAVLPCEVIGATAGLFRPVFATAGLVLEVNCDLASTKLLLDPQRLRQCLSNLLSNALKFTERGRVTVTAALLPDGLLQLDVIDTGKGIVPEDTEAMFQPFLRGTREQSGTGLGLAISRGLARQMAGDLVLLPSATGVHFRLTVQTAPVISAELPSVQRSLDLRGRNILVVDDIATNRLVAATYLRIMQAHVVEAASGAEAVAAVVQARPDLVLLDMNMPGLSGLETLAQLRQLPGRHLPVLAMTADASAASRQRYLEAGLDGYVAKPLTPEGLTAALAEHLRHP